jgi:hypothetical protein
MYFENGLKLSESINLISRLDEIAIFQSYLSLPNGIMLDIT